MYFYLLVSNGGGGGGGRGAWSERGRAGVRVESHIELCGLCSLGNGLFGDGGGHCARRECEYE